MSPGQHAARTCVLQGIADRFDQANGAAIYYPFFDKQKPCRLAVVALVWKRFAYVAACAAVGYRVTATVDATHRRGKAGVFSDATTDVSIGLYRMGHWLSRVYDSSRRTRRNLSARDENLLTLREISWSITGGG